MTGPKSLHHERQQADPGSRPAALPATDRQRKLLASVKARASHVQDQLLILPVEAGRIGASEADVRAVRERLLDGHVRECRDFGDRLR